MSTPLAAPNIFAKIITIFKQVSQTLLSSTDNTYNAKTCYTMVHAAQLI